MMSFLPLVGASALFELLIRATLLIAGAWAAAAALRAAGASAAARHMAWLFGIAALLALPLVWWLAPALRLPILPEAATASADAIAPLAFAPSAFAGEAASSLPLPGGWIGLLLLVYALGAGFLLLRIAIARRLLARVWSEAEGETGPDWDDLLASLSIEVDLPRPVELRIARWPAMPMTWGTIAPRILLPAEALDWPLERRRLVLLHELAHVARRDSLSRTVASLACALYWFHPGAWLAARQMRIEQEHAADDRVLVAGGSAPAYARSLLHLATPADAWPSPAHAASMAGMYQLERRLVSIVNPVRRDRPTAWFFASSASVATLATLAIAAAIPVGSSSVAPDPLRPGIAGIDPFALATLSRPQQSDMPATAAPDKAESRREAASNGVYRQPERGQISSFPNASAENRELRSGPLMAAGEGRTPADAERSEHAASAGVSPTIPTNLARGVPFTLSPVTTDLDPRGDRSPYRLASNPLPATPAAAANVQRSLVDHPPPASNRIASVGRFHLSSSWAQPALP